jgi:hypothetical protein
MRFQLHFKQWLSELVSPGEPEKEMPNHPTACAMPVYGEDPPPTHWVGNKKGMKKKQHKK